MQDLKQEQQHNPYIDWITNSTSTDRVVQSSDLSPDLDYDPDDPAVDPNDQFEADQFDTDCDYEAHAASRRRRIDPSINIPGHVFKKMPQEFRSLWRRFDDNIKRTLIKGIADRAHPDDMDTFGPNAPDWKRKAHESRKPNRPRFNAHHVDIDVDADDIHDFLVQNSIHTKQDLIDFSCHAIANMHSASDTDANVNTGGDDNEQYNIANITFSNRGVNASASKSTKSRSQLDPMKEPGSIQRLMSDPKNARQLMTLPKGETFSLTNNKGAVLKTFTANNVEIERRIDNNVEIERRINSSNCNNDEEEEQEDHSVYPIPPLRTMYRSNAAHQVTFVENNRRKIPYQNGPLTERRRFDSFLLTQTQEDNRNCKTYIVSKGKRSKADSALVDGGANGGLRGRNSKLYSEPHPNGRKVNVTGIDNHQLPSKPIVQCCSVSRDMDGNDIL